MYTKTLLSPCPEEEIALQCTYLNIHRHIFPLKLLTQFCVMHAAYLKLLETD